MSNRNRYDEEFKKRAVKLSHSDSRTVREVADSLGINVSVLNRWRRKYTPAGDITRQAAQKDEITILKLSNAELEEEIELLKKVSAYFVKNQK